MRSLTAAPTADWLPLERALQAELGEQGAAYRDAFQFIGHVRGPDDIGELRLYRHTSTRRYLVLDGAARSYRYHAPSATYGPTELGAALEAALGVQLR